MSARIAFTAQFWGNTAVVCRAIEDEPGPIVEQQFGEFQSWTQAHSFADKLNEGLDLDLQDVRQIVTSSLLAAHSVIEQSINSRLALGRTEAATRSVQLRFVLSELNLALTFCRTASLVSMPTSDRIFLHAQNALQRAGKFLQSGAGPKHELNEVASRTQALKAALRTLDPACLRPGDSERGEGVRRAPDKKEKQKASLHSTASLKVSRRR